MAQKKSGLDINRNIIEENNKMISKYIHIDFPSYSWGLVSPGTNGH